MKFAKFTAYDGSPIYVNPMNINRIYESELTGTLTCIDMIGDGNEQGTFFTVRESIEQVIGVLEMKIIKDKSIIGWLKKDWVSLLIDIVILAFVFCRTISIDTLILILYVILFTIDHHNKYIRYKERNNENS